MMGYSILSGDEESMVSWRIANARSFASGMNCWQPGWSNKPCWLLYTGLRVVKLQDKKGTSIDFSDFGLSCLFSSSQALCYSSNLPSACTFLTTLAGDPTATLQAGISRVTIEPAPIVHPSPIVTPGKIVTPPPIQQSSPMLIGYAYSMQALRLATSVSCVAVEIITFGPIITLSPIVTIAESKTVKLKLA
ncbi:hypothetical protein DER44DRAFT_211699 [Fusarium oxysporum]|nr:hypothetical protein DER44DRAFT_211699 [Fusarium oxysporum]